MRWSSNEAANTSGIYLDSAGLYWVSPRGQSFGRTTGDIRGLEYERFYKYIWSQSYSQMEIGSKGSSSSADWTANRVIKLPDTRGRFLQNPSGAVGATFGSSTVTLGVTNLPPHTHNFRRVNSQLNGTQEGFVYDNTSQSLNTNYPGDGAILTTGSGTPFTITPPTVTMVLLMYTGVRSGQSFQPLVEGVPLQTWQPSAGDFRDSWTNLSNDTIIHYDVRTKLLTLNISTTRTGSLENRIGHQPLMVLPAAYRPRVTQTTTTLIQGAGQSKYISLRVNTVGDVEYRPLDPLPAGTSAQLFATISYYVI
jgi:hypothetical protein